MEKQYDMEVTESRVLRMKNLIKKLLADQWGVEELVVVEKTVEEETA